MSRQHYDLVISLIEEAKQAFISGEGTTPVVGDVELFTKEVDGKIYKFFGIAKDKQATTDYTAVRSHILQEMGLAQETRTLQIIGDSAQYNPEQSKFMQKYFNEKMQKSSHDDELVIYGYTSRYKDNSSEKTKGRTEVNGLVNYWVDQNPEQAKRVLANVVCFHTRQALTESGKVMSGSTTDKGWGCDTSEHVTNFFLVYDTKGKGATFGDDTISSDELTDKCYTYEGGIQSFRQGGYMAKRGKELKGVSGLRGEKNVGCFVPQEDAYRIFFSAPEFFALLQARTAAKGSELTPDEVTTIRDEYVATNYQDALADKSRRVLTNPHRDDAATKDGLFKEGWADLMKEEGYKAVQQHFKGKTFEELVAKTAAKTSATQSL